MSACLTYMHVYSRLNEQCQVWLDDLIILVTEYGNKHYHFTTDTTSHQGLAC